MGWLLHEIALEAVLIVLFVVRWAVERWHGKRVIQRIRSEIQAEMSAVKTALLGENEHE